ncbi:methylated-DNA--[protein]-cysteine S-methyltransferase [Geminicoccaceae bacterium 1502E]|nr:methylated-DNA--[protein]-cysteine S-methyltransferase [Geminicoccaceae bacterium 1502E]
MATRIEEVSQDYGRVERAIRFLETHHLEQPDLARIAEAMELSPFHAQRVFSRWAGVTPKQFLGLLTLEHAKERLRRKESVLDAAYDAGLSGPSRLHDLFVRIEAMTPGEYRRLGQGLTMRWGVHPTPFGDALFVLSDRGLARLAFVGEAPLQDVLDEAKAAWPLSGFIADPAATAPLATRIFTHRSGEEPLRLLLKGTPFQVQVWRALLQIPEGELVSYGSLARRLGKEGASRAVGTACGQNRIGWLVPCHRVLRETGALGGYHWGLPMKRAMLAWEQARQDATPQAAG